MRRNFVKEKLRAGKPSVGTWMEMGHPEISEIMGNFGFDWVVFDMEHAPCSIETVQALMQAMGASPTLPLIRVAWNDPVLIKQALDIGAYGIMVPWVNNREEAVRAVRACMYPQSGGIRGVGPRRASNYGFDEAYYDVADREILIAAQVETEEAIRNLEEIFSVEGIDVAFIGPWDLSMSLGVFRKFNHPKLVGALNAVLETAKKTGVSPGIFSGIEDVDKYIEQGFRFISLASDTELFIHGCKDGISKVKGWRPTPPAQSVV